MLLLGRSAVFRTVVTLLAFWQALVWLTSYPRYILPSPLDVLAAFQRQPLYLFENTLVTFAEIVAGFVAGAVLGTLVAVGMAALPRVGRIVWPLVLVLQAFPVFVIAPLLVIWLGFGMTSKVVMATLIIFFPVTSAFGDGLRRVDQDLLDASALTSASPWQTLFRVRVPLAMPSLISGLRIAAPLAPLGAVPAARARKAGRIRPAQQC